MENVKQKARDEQYCAFLADTIQKYQRPRPDGSIDWSKAFGELLELRNKYIDLAIAERDKEIMETIENTQGSYVEDPFGNNRQGFFKEDIINLITNSKK